MTFVKGHKLARGRQLGSINKRTAEIDEIVERLGINPFEVLLLFAKGDWSSLGYDTEKYVVGISEFGSWEKWTIDPAVRARSAADAVKYLYSQKKSVENIEPSALAGMTPEQKLEAMRQAVRMLETQIKDAGPKDV